MSIKLTANGQVREVPGIGITSRRLLDKAGAKKAIAPATTAVLTE